MYDGDKRLPPRPAWTSWSCCPRSRLTRNFVRGRATSSPRTTARDNVVRLPYPGRTIPFVDPATAVALLTASRPALRAYSTTGPESGSLREQVVEINREFDRVRRSGTAPSVRPTMCSSVLQSPQPRGQTLKLHPSDQRLDRNQRLSFTGKGSQLLAAINPAT